MGLFCFPEGASPIRTDQLSRISYRNATGSINKHLNGVNPHSPTLVFEDFRRTAGPCAREAGYLVQPPG